MHYGPPGRVTQRVVVVLKVGGRPNSRSATTAPPVAQALKRVIAASASASQRPGGAGLAGGLARRALGGGSRSITAVGPLRLSDAEEASDRPLAACAKLLLDRSLLESGA